jgi:hypothetical protein
MYVSRSDLVSPTARHKQQGPKQGVNRLGSTLVRAQVRTDKIFPASLPAVQVSRFREGLEFASESKIGGKRLKPVRLDHR